MASLSDALIRQLLDGRHVASIATHNPNGSIHIVAVWYWFDGTDVFVATSSRSRKARNLQANPQVSLMIDARDPAASYGATLAGSAQILTGELSQKYNAEIHRKYLSEAALADPRVGPVFAAWDALLSGSRRFLYLLGICEKLIGKSLVALSRATLHTYCRWNGELSTRP